MLIVVGLLMLGAGVAITLTKTSAATRNGMDAETIRMLGIVPKWVSVLYLAGLVTAIIGVVVAVAS